MSNIGKTRKGADEIPREGPEEVDLKFRPVPPWSTTMAELGTEAEIGEDPIGLEENGARME